MFKWGKDEEAQGEGRKGKQKRKRIKMGFVHAPTPPKKYNHYVMQTSTNKILKLSEDITVAENLSLTLDLFPSQNVYQILMAQGAR